MCVCASCACSVLLVLSVILGLMMLLSISVARKMTRAELSVLLAGAGDGAASG